MIATTCARQTLAELDFIYQQVIETPLAPMSATWTSRGLYSFQFVRTKNSSLPVGDEMSTRDAANPQVRRWARALSRACGRYFAVGRFEWNIELLDWRGTGEFERQVLLACYAIPSSSVCTYGQLAANVGSPLAARAVGRAMSRNRWPLLIPCHRVVGASGQLTGYSGVGGVSTKRWLLDHEQLLGSHPVG
ncbi:MAG: methylated-DNA--[protein]-cysteine S-methyltransferase [Pirellulaceae bacterium]|nr:methylated-DNA--[protein]-cysteine S-methyltransferase [Pirellulaceae bacterium]